MDDLIGAIRVACATDATDEAKQCGAQACRTILAALDAKEGEPLVPATQSSKPQTANFAAIVGALRGVPADQLLDLAIARLRAALPKDASVPAVAPLNFQIIPVAPLARVVGSAGRSAP
jgi:hypothetical protein